MKARCFCFKLLVTTLPQSSANYKLELCQRTQSKWGSQFSVNLFGFFLDGKVENEVFVGKEKKVTVTVKEE